MNNIEKAVAKYDQYVFGAVGGAFDSLKADLLAADVVEACKAASMAGEPKWYRDQIKATAAEFRAIAS